MTISSEVRKAGPYAGNDVTTSFPFAFKVFSADDMVVVMTDPAGVEAELTGSGTDYSVSLNADQDTSPGGTVEKNSALATGYLLTITSSVPNLQPLDITNQGGFYPKVINNALDRLTILLQQVAEQVGRAVKTNISSAQTPDEMLADIDASVALASSYATASSGSATAAAVSAVAADGFADDAAASAVLAAASAASVDFTIADLQAQTKTAFTTAGSAGTLTVATSPAYGALATGQRMRIKFSQASTGADTLNRDTLGAKSLKQYDSAGAKVAAVFAANQLADVEYDGADYVVLDALPISAKQIQSIAASVSGNALVISASSLSLDFRSTALGSGTVTTVAGTPANLTISSGSTLGTVNGIQSRVAVLAINNSGTIELAAVNVSGGNDLSETGVISTTAEGGAGAADSANVIYSNTARTNIAYRLIGYVESTQATAGTWATAPSKIQGVGGQALASLVQRSHQNVTGSRAFTTTYYNTTGNDLIVRIIAASTSSGQVSTTPTVNGLSLGQQIVPVGGAGFQIIEQFTVPTGASYSVGTAGSSSTPTLTLWEEFR